MRVKKKTLRSQLKYSQGIPSQTIVETKETAPPSPRGRNANASSKNAPRVVTSELQGLVHGVVHPPSPLPPPPHLPPTIKSTKYAYRTDNAKKSSPSRSPPSKISKIDKMQGRDGSDEDRSQHLLSGPRHPSSPGRVTENSHPRQILKHASRSQKNLSQANTNPLFPTLSSGDLTHPKNDGSENDSCPYHTMQDEDVVDEKQNKYLWKEQKRRMQDLQKNVFRYYNSKTQPFDLESQDSFGQESKSRTVPSTGSDVEVEWTEQDSSYGAACPVCGFVPKKTRQFIEILLITIGIFLSLAVVVKISIILNEDHSSDHSSGSSTVKLDDDYYVDDADTSTDDFYNADRFLRSS